MSLFAKLGCIMILFSTDFWNSLNLVLVSMPSTGKRRFPAHSALFLVFPTNQNEDFIRISRIRARLPPRAPAVLQRQTIDSNYDRSIDNDCLALSIDELWFVHFIDRWIVIRAFKFDNWLSKIIEIRYISLEMLPLCTWVQLSSRKHIC